MEAMKPNHIKVQNASQWNGVWNRTQHEVDADIDIEAVSPEKWPCDVIPVETGIDSGD
jgi:hypothetical protein